MRANAIVREVLRDVESKIHQARLNAVSAAVLALIHGGQIGLAALGRAIGPRSHKHGIKRVDRLFGNPALASELDVIYAAITRYVLRSIKRPVILLDWTDAGNRKMCALTAAVPVNGRALTIYSVTVPMSEYSARHVERAFLEKLKAFLGPKCRPILVGDAGFRAPWMQEVLDIGWDFVTRIRGRTQVQRIDEPHWQHWKKLFDVAGRKPRNLGAYRIVRNRGVEAQLVAVARRKQRHRSQVSPRNARAMRATKADREPWFLATSLSLSAKAIVDIYAMRMQIELTFRDLKSHRFGWGFEDSRCRSTDRVAIQIMLVAVASLVSMLVGLAAEDAALQKRYQANTITARRVLSLVALGCAVMRSFEDEPIPIANLASVLPFVGIP